MIKNDDKTKCCAVCGDKLLQRAAQVCKFLQKIKAQTSLTGWIMDRIEIKQCQYENNQNKD